MKKVSFIRRSTKMAAIDSLPQNTNPAGRERVTVLGEEGGGGYSSGGGGGGGLQQ